MDGVYAENRQERFQCIFHFSFFIAAFAASQALR
jgi:hypothetical protein